MSAHGVTNFRQELKVLAVVLLFLIGLELFSRHVASSVGDDRAHIHQFDELVGTGPDHVFLGNSLLLHGLDEEVFPKSKMIKLNPVSTAVLDWEHIYERYFSATEKKPKHLFLCFVAHHVDDSEPVKLRRLSRHFVSSRSLPELWRNENLDFHQRVQSTLSHSSALIGDQPSHRERILDYFIDWYRLGLRTNQEFLTLEPVPRESSFVRLERFVKFVKSDGVQLWFIPMPQPEVWDMAPELETFIQEHELGFLDAREIPGMTPDDFSDGYHLGESGSVRFSEWLAQQMAALEK